MSVSLLQIPQLRELEEKYARILGPGVLMEGQAKPLPTSSPIFILPRLE